MMPQITFAAGRLQLAFYDFRNDVSGIFEPYVNEATIISWNATHQDPADKKKRHTVKNVLLGDDRCQVPFLSDTYEGSRHDKPIADQTRW